MPTLRTPTHTQVFPEEFRGASATQGITAGNLVRSTLDPVTDGIGDEAGNSVDDHLASLKSAVEDAGTDLSDLTVTDRTPVANDAILERLADGTTQFNRRLITMLLAAQTATDVSALIDTQVARLATNSHWKGAWTPSDYAVNDYVTHSSNYYRCTVARSPSDATGPAGDTDSWDAVTGTELQIVQRVRDVVELIRDRIQLTPATANRGQWPAREPGGDGYLFRDPPMLWHGPWNSSTRYYFGAVTTHLDRLWTLTSSGSRISPVSGNPTAPGTDSAWSEISIGHHLDIPHFQGLWADLAGHTFKIGDLIDAAGLTYICKAAYTRTNGSAHPSADNQHWDLLDNWVGAIAEATAYHEGATGTFDGNVWIADADVAVDDPEPGADANTKWRQLTGPTQADLDRVRSDLENQIHSATRAQGPTVTALPEPPDDTDPVEVYLSRKSNRNFTAPAAQNTGSSSHTTSIGDEIGLYKRTSGTANRVSGIVGSGTAENLDYYGIFTRAYQDPGYPLDLGKFEHNPIGGAFIHAGIREASNGTWTPSCLVKQNLLTLMGGGTELTSFYMRVWNHAGVEQTPYHFTRALRTRTLGNVNYQEMVSVDLAATAAGAFRDIYDAGSDEDTRRCEFAISRTATSDPLYLGNRTIAWRKETDVSESDANLVFSSEIHTLKLMGDSVYAALVALPPNTAFYLYDDS